MKAMKKTILAALMAVIALSASAQQVTTLYFLENAPMRHTINPAFQPVSDGFINFSPLGWTSMSLGNNAFTMSDILFVDPETGKTITPLHPNANRAAFLSQVKRMTYANGDLTLGLLNFGMRRGDKGYFTLGVNARVEMGATIPKSAFTFLLDGGMKNLESGINPYTLTGLGLGATVYSEISGGYSYQLNDEWTIGGKLKFLMGNAYGGVNNKRFNLELSKDKWAAEGIINLDVASSFVNVDELSTYLKTRDLETVIDDIENDKFPKDKIWFGTNDIVGALIPVGYGGAIDFGFTYKPLEQLQISAALTDLGFIYWHQGTRFNCAVDSTKFKYEGVGEIEINDPRFKDDNGEFSSDILMDTVLNRLKTALNGVGFSGSRKGFARMTSARLNIGLDANFWDNRVGVGIVSATRLYNGNLYEEVTLGASFRPFNWLNIAATYSLMNNGKYSNIGAGLSIMPYDGINLTLAMDYIPTSYAPMDVNGQKRYIIPDKSKMFNLAMGFSICWGTNRRDSDKDGVWDKLDMCPNTPRGVQVDSVGCPLDEDHDGVPDYLDRCPGTPAAAIGFVDSIGCELDTDGDGVPDYRDKCPRTPREAWGKVDENGCPKDTDGDGVPDYLDKCPDTPAAAYGMVDKNGCPKDSDGDGVPDYLDKCPDTPAEARGTVDENGCPKDSDGDGVPNYKDECPNTPAAARGYVDVKGCELDSDGDGIFDYQDECPTVPGTKANKGCPELKREVRQLLQKAMQGIEFETAKATIKPKSYPLLNQIAKIFIENSNYIIEVQGHTDNVGKADYNMKLSDQRANSVMKYLTEHGVPAERMTAKGYGLTQPIADNKTAAGRQKNRRVEFKISFEEVHVETILDHADPTPAPKAE